MCAYQQTDEANDIEESKNRRIEESNNLLRGFEESDCSREHLELK
jgi:hypothetical protein